MYDQRATVLPAPNHGETDRTDLCSELNVERFELRKDGAIALNHPSGTHDDVFWSLALGVYATVDMKEFDLDALRFG